MFTVSTPCFLSFWDFRTSFFIEEAWFWGVRVGFGGREGALASALIYPITLNGYIYSPGKKIEKMNKKIEKKKKLKKLKIFGTISGALARSLIRLKTKKKDLV